MATLMADAADKVHPVALFVRPRSIAVIGVSAKPGSAGRNVAAHLLLNDFPGALHLVGRSGGEVEGHPVLTDPDELPMGIDLAVLAVPAAGAKEALEACARRGVRAVTLFASGFAEVGNREGQDELVRIADAAGIHLLGPNCLGYSNSVDRIGISFAGPNRMNPLPKDRRDPAVAILSQSGGLMAYAAVALKQRNLPAAFTISTGNEAGIGLADFVDFLVDDPAAAVIVMYLEEVRDPQALLAAARRARDAGKAIVLVHPGRSAQGRAAVQSHTGALAGDYAVMQVHLARAGVVLVETMEDLVDVTEILARFPVAPVKSPGVLTFSGGFCALAHDYFEQLDIALPPLSPETVAGLTPQLPSFTPPRNPLDLGTQTIWQPELCEIGATAFMKEENVGSLLVAIAATTPPSQRSYAKHFVDALSDKRKPAILAFGIGDILPEFKALIDEQRIILSASIERSMRALAYVTHYGEGLQRAVVTPAPFGGLPDLAPGTQSEWVGKYLLSAIGVPTPPGALATDVEAAVKIASEAGYPIVLKGQAAALPHKTEAGAVLLGIADEAALRVGWDRIHANVAKAAPGLVLDGVLVEAMAAKGLELMIGATRDPQWGPILLVGLGGTWVEALGDVRLLPADLAPEDIVAEIRRLRSAKLLDGFRDMPPLDVEAVAQAAAAIGRLMLTRREIGEIDINPLFVHAKGQGVTAADALVVVSD